jgi:class 3 adenylate cyclase
MHLGCIFWVLNYLPILAHYSIGISLFQFVGYSISINMSEVTTVSDSAKADRCALIFIFLLVMAQQALWREYFLRKNHLNIKISRNQARMLNLEEERHGQLLGEMLPADMLAELKACGDDREPDQAKLAAEHSDVTVLFCKLDGFIQKTKDLAPRVAVGVLNEIWTTLDEVVNQHQVYKVETIGAVYMAVAGCPKHTSNNSHLCCNAALGMMAALAELQSSEEWTSKELPIFQLKIGLHTGPVVAGLLGMRFKLVGDTVNTASRMCSSGASDCIQMSEATYAKLTCYRYDTTLRRISRRHMRSYRIDRREPFHVKGKGMMQTFFLSSATPSAPYEAPVFSLHFVSESLSQRDSETRLSCSVAMADAVESVAGSGSSGIPRRVPRAASRLPQRSSSSLKLMSNGSFGSVGLVRQQSEIDFAAAGDRSSILRQGKALVLREDLARISAITTRKSVLAPLQVLWLSFGFGPAFVGEDMGHTQIDIELEAGFKVTKLEGWLRLCRMMALTGLFVLDVLEPVVYIWSQQETEELGTSSSSSSSSSSGSSSGGGGGSGRLLRGGGTSSSSKIDWNFGMSMLIARCSLLTPALMAYGLLTFSDNFLRTRTRLVTTVVLLLSFGVGIITVLGVSQHESTTAANTADARTEVGSASADVEAEPTGLLALFVVVTFFVDFLSLITRLAIGLTLTLLYLVSTPHFNDRTDAWGVYRNVCLLVCFCIGQLFVVFLYEYRERIDFNIALECRVQKHVLENEEKNHARLLRRLLPAQIVTRLVMMKDRFVNNQRIIADAFDSVTILQTDLVGFTTFSAAMTPLQLRFFLNSMYQKFDTVVRAHSLHKMEIIGDAMVIVGGCPGRRPPEVHASACLRAALQLNGCLARAEAELNVLLGLVDSSEGGFDSPVVTPAASPATSPANSPATCNARSLGGTVLPSTMTADRCGEVIMRLDLNRKEVQCAVHGEGVEGGTVSEGSFSNGSIPGVSNTMRSNTTRHSVNTAAGAIHNFNNGPNAGTMVKVAMRIGVHSGPVVAGIIGSKDLRYHVFGESMRVAEAMEANGKNSHS